MPSKLLIIDGHSLAYRCYYAMKNTATGLIVDPDGTPITISKGFLRSLWHLLNKHNPTHLAVCFDPGGKTWRHELYPDYKVSREKDPDEQHDINIDIRNLQAILREKAIAVCIVPNYEADDVIATIIDQVGNQALDQQGDNYDLEIVISSADKDLLQLVDDDLNVVVDHQQGKKSIIYDETTILNELGVAPWQIPDYKALVGDKSDDIPGVKGIGAISAVTLLRQFGTQNVENIIKNLDQIPKSLAKKIEPQKDNLVLFKKLTKLDWNIKITCSIYNFAHTDLKKRSAIAIELGIK